MYNVSRAGILFVVREVLPVAASWRYEKPGEREQILLSTIFGPSTPGIPGVELVFSCFRAFSIS